MDFLDLNDDVILHIFAYLKPEDLLSTYDTCERLREISLCVIDKVGPRLNITGKNCFLGLNFRKLETNLERIAVNKNWTSGSFKRENLFNYKLAHISKIVINDKQLYVSNKGEIRKYDRSKEDHIENLTLFCNIEDPIVSTFVVKEDVLFAGTYDGTCVMIINGLLVINDLKIHESYKDILALDFNLNHSVFITSNYCEIKVWKWNSEEKVLNLMDEIFRKGRCMKLDKAGRRFIVGDNVINYFLPRPELRSLALYDLEAVSGNNLNCLSEGVLDVVWKDDNTILTGHWDGSLRIFDLRANADVLNIKSEKVDKNCSIQFDGSSGVLCGFQKQEIVNYCDLRTGKIINTYGPFPHPEMSTHLQGIAADSSHLYVVNNYEVTVCDFSY